jgi:ATP-binding cassette, subfamily B, bacterial MsbA
MTAPHSPTPRGLPSPAPLTRLWPRVKPHLPFLAGAFLCLMSSTAISLAFPWLIRLLLDTAFFKSATAQTLDRIALFLVGLFAIKAVFNFAEAYLLSATGERVVARLRQDLFGRLVHLSPGFFADRRTGELTSRLSTDTQVLQGVLSHQLAELARQVLTVVGAIVMLSLTHPRLTAVTLAVVPLVVGSTWMFGRRLRRISTGVQDKVAEATAVAEEAFSQIRVVQGFAQEAAEERRYGDRIAEVVRAALKRALVRGGFFGVITIGMFGGIAAVFWQGGRLVLAGALTPGTLVQFLFYAFMVAAAVGTLAGLYSSYQEAVGAAKRVFELLETESAVPDAPDAAPLPRGLKGAVAFEDVSFRYQADAPWALHQVSLRAEAGQVIALVGPSGAGKTTLGSLLFRFWDPTEGRITLDGVDLRRLRLADLRSVLAMVPQEPVLFSGTVAANIAYGRPEATPEEIEAAARAAHAAEFVERLKDRYQTVVGERGVKLSAGQRQRIAIARAVLRDPAVLLLDEATSNLDSESERLVEEAMERLLEGRTTFIIAHRLSTVRRADRLIVLDRGRVVEEGTHDELLARAGLYARLYQRQFRDEDPLVEINAPGE